VKSWQLYGVWSLLGHADREHFIGSGRLKVNTTHTEFMGDKKPKKNSSGTGDAHKAKQAQQRAARPDPTVKPDNKGKK
jgi:hypothetical protein